MCGIVGYIGPKRVVPLILDGLKRLEYRGYDSAGIAVLGENGKVEIRRAPQAAQPGRIDSHHSPRWHLRHRPHPLGQHGRPPRRTLTPPRLHGEIVVVHNGIIENYVQLKKQLIAEGHKFRHRTDTEIIAHLIEKFSKDTSLEEAVRKSLR